MGGKAGKLLQSSDLPWYAGRISKQEAEAIVLGHGLGDFLVRESTVDQSAFHISINDHGTASHYMVNQDPAGKFVMGAQGFDDFQALLHTLLKRGLKGREGKIALGMPVGMDSSVRKTGDTSVLQRVRRQTSGPWYAGEISEQEAASIIGAWESGSFLVRRLNPNQCELVVNEQGTPNRSSISTHDDGECQWQGKSFPDMDHFIKHVKKHGVPGIRSKGKLALGQPVGFSAKTGGAVAARSPSGGSNGHHNGGSAPPAAQRSTSPQSAQSSRPASRPASRPTSSSHSRSQSPPGGPPVPSASGSSPALGLSLAPKPPSRQSSNFSTSSDLDFAGEPWYAGTINRPDAESLVLSGGPGTYLIRKDAAYDCVFYLSVNDHGAGTHYRVEQKADGKVALGPSSFDNMDALITALKSKGIKGSRGKVRLASPRVQHGPAVAPRRGSVGSDGAEFRSRNTTMWSRSSKDAAGEGDAIQMPPNVKLDIAPLDVDGFVALPRRKTHEDELPAYARGRKYNRYRDVLPNPVTRVRLRVVDEEPHTDYYNANYIRGYGARNAREYIAAQAPLPHTVPQFLRLMWEKRITTVAMTTNLVEKGKKKCEAYWPREPGQELTYGRFRVANRGVERRGGYVLTQLELRLGEESHELAHFWYNTWPDHGVPRDEEGNMQADRIVRMLEAIQEHRTRSDKCESPLLVHCSAGIGRTGTLIIIDQAMTALRLHEHVDLVRLTAQIREDRMAMVQETAQYKFAYQAYLDFASRHAVADSGEIYAVAKNKGMLRRLSSDGQWRQVSGPPSAAGSASASPAAASPAGSVVYATVGKLQQSEEDTHVFAPEEESHLLPAQAVVSASPTMPRRKQGLSAQPWFRTGYSRAQVEQMLSDSPAGTFLVRESSKPGHFALSVQEGGKIVNLLIIPLLEAGGATRYKLGTTTTRIFPSVQELVQHYIDNPVRENHQGQHVKLVANATTGSTADDDDAEC